MRWGVYFSEVGIIDLFYGTDFDGSGHFAGRDDSAAEGLRRGGHGGLEILGESSDES